MDGGDLGPAATAELAGAQNELRICRLLQTVDIAVISTTAKCAGAQTQLRLRKSDQTMDREGPGI